MKLNAQERAHEAIRLNKLLGLKGTKTINEVKIQRYKRTHPNQTKITLAILANLRLSKGQTLPELFEIIAKEAECNVSEVRKFFLHTIDSVLLNERRIGKQLVTPALIKFAKKFVFSAEQTEQTAKVVTTKKVVSTDTKEASYESQGKVVVRERLKELLVDKKSPKEGEILTLANLFQFEIELLKLPVLYLLRFFVIEKIQSVFNKQCNILRKNKTLDKRVSRLCNGDMTQIINAYGKNSFAHIFADFCGEFANGIKSFTQYVVENDLVKVGGIIWFTYDKRSRSGAKEIDKEVLELIKKYGGKRYKIEQIEGNKVYEYKGHLSNPNDGRSGSNMLTVIIRRVK